MSGVASVDHAGHGRSGRDPCFQLALHDGATVHHRIHKLQGRGVRHRAHPSHRQVGTLKGQVNVPALVFIR